MSFLPWQGGTTQLHWLQEKEWCDYPSNVDCGDRPICDEFDENCTGGPPPTGGPPGGTCDEIEAQCQANEIFPKGDCEQCYCQGRRRYSVIHQPYGTAVGSTCITNIQGSRYFLGPKFWESRPINVLFRLRLRGTVQGRGGNAETELFNMWNYGNF